MAFQGAWSLHCRCSNGESEPHERNQQHASFESEGEMRREARWKCKIKPPPYLTEVKEKED